MLILYLNFHKVSLGKSPRPPSKERRNPLLDPSLSVTLALFTTELRPGSQVLELHSSPIPQIVKSSDLKSESHERKCESKSWTLVLNFFTFGPTGWYTERSRKLNSLAIYKKVLSVWLYACTISTSDCSVSSFCFFFIV